MNLDVARDRLIPDVDFASLPEGYRLLMATHGDVDAAGRFLFTRARPGPYVVEIATRAPGDGSLESSARHIAVQNANTSPIVFDVPGSLLAGGSILRSGTRATVVAGRDAASLTGRVISDSGNVLTRSVIRARLLRSSFVATAIADERGEFAFGRLPPICLPLIASRASARRVGRP
jgi:hypothetical protein